MLVEDRRVVADELFERRYPGSGFDVLGALMHRRDCRAQFANEVVRKLAAFRQAVERAVLIEASHPHGPPPRFTCAAERKCAVAFACDWHEPAIELGREFAIDFEFGLARGFPFSQCRKIKKWIAHGAFDFERPPACKKHNGGVCLMASYFHYRARRGGGPRVAAQFKDVGLLRRGCGCVIRKGNSCGNGTAKAPGQMGARARQFTNRAWHRINFIISYDTD